MCVTTLFRAGDVIVRCRVRFIPGSGQERRYIQFISESTQRRIAQTAEWRDSRAGRGAPRTFFSSFLIIVVTTLVARNQVSHIHLPPSSHITKRASSSKHSLPISPPPVQSRTYIFKFLLRALSPCSCDPDTRTRTQRSSPSLSLLSNPLSPLWRFRASWFIVIRG